MDVTTNGQEETIRFTWSKAKGEYNFNDYHMKSTDHKLTLKRIHHIGTRVNKLIKTNEKAENQFKRVLQFIPLFWGILSILVVYAYHRRQTAPLHLFEINFYMLLLSASFAVYFILTRALNRATDKKYRVVQKFLMEKNQYMMKSGYRWNIKQPAVNPFDVLIPRKLYYQDVELLRDSWTVDDFTLVEDEQENIIRFPYNERSHNFVYQSYTPRLTNYRLTLDELTSFFSKIEDILQSDKTYLKHLSYIESSQTIMISFISNIVVFFLLKTSGQGNFEFYGLISLFIYYCVALKVMVSSVNDTTIKKHKLVENLMTLENGDVKDRKGISWELGGLIMKSTDPLTKGIFVFGEIELRKEYGHDDENIFYDEAFDKNDDSFENENEKEEGGDQSMQQLNSSISNFFTDES